MYFIRLVITWACFPTKERLTVSRVTLAHFGIKEFMQKCAQLNWDVICIARGTAAMAMGIRELWQVPQMDAERLK